MKPDIVISEHGRKASVAMNARGPRDTENATVWAAGTRPAVALTCLTPESLPFSRPISGLFFLVATLRSTIVFDFIQQREVGDILGPAARTFIFDELLATKKSHRVTLQINAYPSFPRFIERYTR